MKICVTAKHIKKGKRNEGHSCPIALAIREELDCAIKAAKKLGKEDTFKVDVGGAEIYIGNDSYIIPEKACKFIEKFDDGGTVKPFSFTFK